MARKKSNGARYTIGFLTQVPTGEGGFNDQVWESMVKAAREKDINLFLFAGGAIDQAPYNPYEQSQNLVYELITQEIIDGLIISNIIGAYITETRFLDFCQKLALPLVTVFGGIQKIPSVQVANREGMRATILHLIRDHHFKKIAFIIGRKGYPDSDERFVVYQDTLRECHIDYDPDLVFQGQFDVDSGEKAAEHFMNLKNKQIEAIVASNDAMAFGAIKRLRALGKNVPWDIAVTGFDDTNEAAAATPPLTTVHQPFGEVMSQALEMLCTIIEKKAGIALHNSLPAQIIVRQSCSCKSEIIGQAENFIGNGSKTDAYIPNPDSDMKELAKLELLTAANEEDKKSIPRILTSLIEDIENRQPDTFIRELNITIQERVIQGLELHSWQRYLYILKKWTSRFWQEQELVFNAGNRILQASVMIGELGIQALAFRKLMAEKKSKELRDAGQNLITTFDFDQLKQVIKQQITRLNIPSCFISIFKDIDDPGAGAEVFLISGNDEKLTETDWVKKYAVHSLPPLAYFPTGKRYTYAVHPLYFKETKLGYALFELGPETGEVYDVLQVQISSALMGSGLILQKEKTEKAEIERNNSIQELVRPMLASITNLTKIAQDKIGMISGLTDVTKESSEKLNITNTAIISMNEKLERMSDIISIIDDISAQVNVLAINTSIESAHAGQFGKGFTIIANEIRKLADSIKENTTVISHNLKGIKPSIDISRKAGKESQEAFERLEKDVMVVSRGLQQITDSMNSITANSSQILNVMNRLQE